MKSKRLIINGVFLGILMSLVIFWGNANSVESAPKMHSGLLIGLSSNGHYRTLWIVPDKDKLKLRWQTNLIVVPYGHDFWKIQSKVFKWNQPKKSAIDVHYLLSDPMTDDLKKGFMLKTPDKMMENDTYRSTAVLTFIGNQYVSLSEDYTLYGTGAAHPIGERHSRIVEIKDVSTYNQQFNLVISPREHQPLSLLDIFGSKIIPLITKYKEQPVTDQEKKILGTNMSNIENYTNEDEWRVIRKNGKWIAQIAKVLAVGSYGFQDIFYDIPYPLPKSLVAFDGLDPAWNSIKKDIPEAVDAVSSPLKDILAIFTKDQLILFSSPNIGKINPSLVIKLNNNESLVMVHWATGNDVDQWSQKIRMLE